MSDLANGLRPSDTFNIVVFADGSNIFSPVSVPATRANLTRALQFIGQRNGGGGTELLAALERAVALPRQSNVSRSVVLVTDGYIEAESDVFDYVRDHARRHQCLRVRHWQQREPVPHRGSRARWTRRALYRHRTRRGDRGGDASFRRYIDSPVLTGSTCRSAASMPTTSSRRRFRTSLPAVRLSSSESGEATPADRSRSRGTTGRGPYQRVDRRIRGERRRAACVRFDTCGHEPGSRSCPTSVLACPSEQRVGRDHVARPDLRAAHALHVVHRGAGNRAAHYRERRRRRPAASAAAGVSRPRRRRHQRRGTGARVDLRRCSRNCSAAQGCCA